MRTFVSAVVACTAVTCTVGVACAGAQPSSAWKAGVAKVVITPAESLWMAGYAARNKPSEGTAQDLYAKALALDDGQGGRLVIVTLDLVGIPRPLRDNLAKDIEASHKLPPAALLLNASHTHCGPVVRSGGSVLYDLGDDMSRRIERYLAGLHAKIVDVVGEALADLKPARLGYSRARAGFAMNRRLPTEKGPINSPYPDGPVHHEVPVLRVDGADGKTLRAVLFGYACHNTTLSFYQFCGDYAGYAQEHLEKDHPGAVALFMTGCGGDQNPYPRGTLELAKQHGRTLATAVEAALLPKARPVRGPLHCALEETTLDFVPPNREELLKLKESKAKNEQRRAELLLQELEKTGTIHAKYAYPVQVVQFGGDLTMIALAGEVVVDYAHRLQRELPGAPVWVAGYCNDVFGYVPSVRVLKEGGYEGGGAMRFTRLPGPFAATVEERIVGKVHDLVREVRSQARK
jgi:neutral ceramidase